MNSVLNILLNGITDFVLVVLLPFAILALLIYGHHYLYEKSKDTKLYKVVVISVFVWIPYNQFLDVLWSYTDESVESEQITTMVPPELIKVEIEPMPPEDLHLKRLAYEIENSIVKPNTRLQEIKQWETLK